MINWYKIAQTEESKDWLYLKKYTVQEPHDRYNPDLNSVSQIIRAFDARSNKEIGYVKYGSSNKNFIYVYYIKVEPTYWRQGIARKLIEEIMHKENVSYQQINWSLVTHDGQKLKHNLDDKYGPAPFNEYVASN